MRGSTRDRLSLVEANLVVGATRFVPGELEAVLQAASNEWEAFQIGNGNFFVLGAVYNAKLMSLVQLVVIDIQKNKKYIFEKLLPPWRSVVGQSMLNSVSYSSGRKFSFHIHNHAEKNRLRVTIRTRGQKGMPDMNCSFEAYHDKTV